MIFRIAAGLMAGLLAFAAALNLNDPDPVPWVAIYAAAAAISAYVTGVGTIPTVIPALVGGVALVWAGVWSRRVASFDAYRHMFDEWEMKSQTVEEARETCGLLIVAMWMLAIVVRSL